MGKRHAEGKTIGGIMLRNGHWYARIKSKGRQKWRSAPDKESAQLILGRMREDAARERVGLPKVQRDTLAAFAPKYQAWAKLHKRSWQRDDQLLAPVVAALGHFRLVEITKSRAEAYMRNRRGAETHASIEVREAFDRRAKAGKVPEGAKPPAPKTLAPATVNREAACLRRLLSFAVESGELTDNPLRGLRLYAEPPGRVPVLEPEDEGRLLAAVPEWMRPVVRLAVATGCRQGELLALRWKHVNFAAGALVVEDSKSGESRRVPLHPAVLDELRARRGLPDGYVVTVPGGTSPSPYSVSQAFRRAVRRIGRADLRFHDLRHCAGSRLLTAGASLPEVAAMLGHKTLVMAQRYSHVNPTRLASLVAAMPAPGGTPATATAAKAGKESPHG